MTFNQFVLNNYNAEEIAELIKTGFLEVIQKCGMNSCEPIHYRPGPNAPQDWQMGEILIG